MSYAFRCEVCDGDPLWSIERRGDVVSSWSCADHFTEVALRLQRDHEVTELVVRHAPKLHEWADISRSLAAIDPGTPGGEG